MQADLANPPPPPSSASSGQPPPRPALGTRQSTRRSPADRAKRALDKKAGDLHATFDVEDDLVVFERALRDEPVEVDGSYLGNGNGHAREGTEGVQKIQAVSDFAPIKEKVKRPKRQKDIVREGWAYHVSRWPLLFLIFTLIFFEFLLYLLVRQLVNLFEYLSGFSSPARRRLRRALRSANSYQEWTAAALALDKHLGLDKWKKEAKYAYYDHALVRRVLRTLKDLRAKADAEGVSAVLYAALRTNFAGVESFRLYSETFFGTKELVEEYVEEVEKSVDWVREVGEDGPEGISLEEKASFFKSAAKNLGASALCLSGGASFGYYHFGVVRALLDENLLPRVITGTSAGAIVAAITCTRTDAELRTLLVPELANRITACNESTLTWIKRAWRTGARFDSLEWARKAAFFTLGNLTFKEAFERTGRILNVSVIPTDTHSPTKLLNYLTAPDCVIYTAVIASAAVPGILNPVVLLTKTREKDGREVVRPWDFQGKHKDGSLRVDIPLDALHRVYNVNFSIVSQVNPHIHLFHFAPRGAPGRPVTHRKGKGWRGGFFLSAAEQFLKLELTKNFRVIRDLELMPEFGGQNWGSVFLQKFEGTVTIWPKSRLVDWIHILTDPDSNELARMIRVGQGVAWPKLHMIQNRLRIERAVERGREEVQRRLAARGSRVGSSISLLPLDHSRGEQQLADYSDSASEFDSPAPSPSLAPPETNSRGSRDPSPASVARRRRTILAKLGLKHTGPPSYGGTPNGSDVDGTGTGTDGERGQGGFSGGSRRYKMGSLRRARRVLGNHVIEGEEAGSTEDELEALAGGDGDEVELTDEEVERLLRAETRGGRYRDDRD